MKSMKDMKKEFNESFYNSSWEELAGRAGKNQGQNSLLTGF